MVDGKSGWTEKQQQILETALGLVEREGIEGLSMRRLASALGLDAAALYWHFRNKEELLSSLTLYHMERVQLEVPPPGPWRERCRVLCCAMRDEMLKRPEIVLLEEHGNLLAPFHMRASNLIMKVLLEAGFSERKAILAGQTLSWHVLGVTRIELHIPSGPPAPEVVRRLSEHAALAETGRVREGFQKIADAYAKLTVPDLFHYGLERILDGIEADFNSA